jgi:hypothetical protein
MEELVMFSSEYPGGINMHLVQERMEYEYFPDGRVKATIYNEYGTTVVFNYCTI